MKGTNEGEGQIPFDLSTYESIGVDPLLVYAAKRVLDAGEECTLERLLYECFVLFPRKFGLSRYPQWPDATRVYRSWRRCRLDNGWLVGNPQEGFSLTRRGEEVADTINQRLKTPSVKTPVPREATKTRGKEEAIARYLRRSGTFGRWSQNPITFSISESELRSLLNATLETSKTVLRMNLEYYRENAKLVRAKDVVDFLDACRAQHKGILGER